MPNGNAATTYTATAVAAETAASRTRRCDSSTIKPAMTSAGTESALIDTAAPAASPIHTAVRRRGWSRYLSASATASTENASDGPSALTGTVTHSTDPLVVTSPAASNALPRVVTWRAHAYTEIVSNTPAATDTRRGASIVRKPTRSATHTRGRNTGP